MQVISKVSNAMKNYWSLEIELYRASAHPTNTGAEHKNIDIKPSKLKGMSMLVLVSSIDSSSLPINLLCSNL